MDCFGARRAQLVAVLERALQSGAAVLADRRSGQRSLFESLQEEVVETATIALPEIPEWDDRELLKFEKEVLGFYRSSHPLAQHQVTLNTYCSHTTANIPEIPDRGEVMLGGMLSSIKFAHVRQARPGSTGTKYVNFDLEDVDGTIRCILWPKEFEEFGELVRPESIVVLRGIVDRRGGGDEANLIVNELIPLDQLGARYTRGMIVRVQQAQHGEHELRMLREIVRGYPGPCELQLLMCLENGSRVLLAATQLRVEVTAELRSRLDDLLGPGNVRLLTDRSNGRPTAPRAPHRPHALAQA
jgi:DNA polymerase-3 subunit alpha